MAVCSIIMKHSVAQMPPSSSWSSIMRRTAIGVGASPMSSKHRRIKICGGGDEIRRAARALADCNRKPASVAKAIGAWLPREVEVVPGNRCVASNLCHVRAFNRPVLFPSQLLPVQYIPGPACRIMREIGITIGWRFLAFWPPHLTAA